jgi:arylsulfatase
MAGVELPKDRSLDGRDIRSYLMPKTHQQDMPEFEFYYSGSDNKPSAFRMGPWKMHIRISSQTGNDYGFTASRETPLLFQVEQDISERINQTNQQQELVKTMMTKLKNFEAQVEQEGSFWDAKP